MCPFSGACRFDGLDVAQLAGLGKASEGKKRELLSIPDGYNLESTGVRVDFVKRSGSNGDKRSDPATIFRGTAYATPLDNKTVILRTADLPKRNEPSWSGVHLHLRDGETLVVQVQERHGETGYWTDSFEPVVIEPLKAFTVEGQDIVWFKTPIDGSVAKSGLVWAELSLQKKSNRILDQAKGTNIASRQRQRKIVNAKFEAGKRDDQEVENDRLMLKEVMENPDPMTKQDIVYMKDIWNKCSGWISITGEHFTESLFLRCPDLLQRFGDIPAELAFDMFVSLIDMSVRKLDERTEVIARESYGAMPLMPSVDAPFSTLEEGFIQFAQLGMRPIHWKEARVIFLVVMKDVNPYIEENDLDLLALGTKSCVYRFWTQHVMKPALLAIRDMDDIFDSDENRDTVIKSFEPLAMDKHRSGLSFYRKMFHLHPEVIPYFGTTDMDFFAGHLFEAIELLANIMPNFEKAVPILHHLGKIHDRAKIPVVVYNAVGDTLDVTLRELIPEYGNGTAEGEKLVSLWSALFNRCVLVMTRISFVSERLLRKAHEWVDQVAHELKWDPVRLAKRRLEISDDVRTRGTYSHTEEELAHGARVAWRNSAKCIGRIAWNTLMVRDRRHVKNLDAMFAECLEHQRLATADGSLKAVMTVFSPRQPGTRMGTRFWNLQLVRFACYENDDGTLMGDGANKTYTDECIAFGWKPPVPRTEFDVLPIVIEDPIAGITKMFELPKEYHKVTMITHPKFPEFGKLGLRWCVVPTVTSFTLRLGGLEYPCNPFNGWFQETEITRDLLEPGRMDKMEAIARAIGLDPTDEEDFWRERVAIETNKAVMHSFRKDGHSIVDHMTAQSQFLAHDAREKREGRECPAQWSWVVPAFGGSTMPIWHHEMRDFYIEPQYDYQSEIYNVRKESQVKEEELLASDEKGNAFEKLLIAYASVTGTAESYAYKAKKMLRPLQVDVISCESLKPTEIWSECVEGGGQYSAVLFITSTFGEGSAPPSAEDFFHKVKSLPVSALSGAHFSVMAIGSTVYPDYCQAGVDLDKALNMAGGKQLIPLCKGDEVNKQEDAVFSWISKIGSLFDLEQKKALIASGDVTEAEETEPFAVETLLHSDERVVAALSEAKELFPSNGIAGTMARFLPAGYKLCKVTKNEELVDFTTAKSRDLFKSTRYLEFDLSGISKKKSDLIYETGDHARILPVNDKSLVLDMCNCLGVQPQQWVQIDVRDGPKLSASIMQIGDLFSFELDLAVEEDSILPLLDRMLQTARNPASSEVSTDELGKLELLVERLHDALHSAEVEPVGIDEVKEEQKANGGVDEIGGIGGIGLRQGVQLKMMLEISKSSRKNICQNVEKSAGAAPINEQYVTIPELLKQFPTITPKLMLADCIETLARLKPRHYSIASSSEMHPDKLQLSVGKLAITHKSTGKVCKGVCSHFLASTTASGSGDAGVQSTNAPPCANATGFVRLGLSRSTFRLPQDYKAPIIMVGPGTGIAPMLGFLQAREHAKANGEELGQCMVFFGCRAENDFIHGKKMKEWVDNGIITDLQVAFSRLPGHPKEYVQHKISMHKCEVWNLLSMPNAHYYICGDSKMADDVLAELKHITITTGGLDRLGSIQFFSKMKKERRFQSDTWGVVHNRKENLDKMVEKVYNKGEHWLRSFEVETSDNKIYQ